MKGVWVWVLSVLLAVLIVGLVGYARGPEHHRGDEVGSLSPTTSVTVGR